MQPDPHLVLRLSAITKRFGSLVANEAIGLDLRRGEILALLGENGAGKTTLMNILFGHYVADQGEIRVAGADGALRALPGGSPHAALEAGIGMVHQHFALAESLTVLENIVLGARPLLAPTLRLNEARCETRRSHTREWVSGSARPASFASDGRGAATGRDSPRSVSRCPRSRA